MKSKVIIVFFLFIIAFQNPNAYADFAGGEGTENSPYEIENWEHLNNVRGELDAYYKLIADLDEGTQGYEEHADENSNDGAGWEPIGTAGAPFEGNFDGDIYTIYDLNINREGSSDIGLFGHTDSVSEIINVSLINFSITGDSSTGGLVGTNRGTISYSDAEGTVKSMATSLSGVGGLVGHNYGKVKFCVTKGLVDAENAGIVGGLAGGQNGGKIIDSYSLSTIKGQELVGGIVGHSYDSSEVKYSHFKGIIEASQEKIGGLVGESEDDSLVSQSFSAGEIYVYEAGSRDFIGGLVGHNLHSSIDNSYSVSYIEAPDYVGGLVGENGGYIDKSYFAGTINCDGSNVGGLVEWHFDEHGEITDSFWDKETSGVEDSNGGTEKTTTEMQDIDTYINLSTDGLEEKWDMVLYESWVDETWYIEEGEDYPRLGWQWEPPIEVETNFASDVTATSAILRGEVIDTGEETVDAYFEYREKDEEEWTYDTQSQADSVSEPSDFSHSISNLIAGRKYDYRAVVSDEENTVYCEEIIPFSTLSEKTWDTNEDWEAYESKSNIVIDGSQIRLALEPGEVNTYHDDSGASSTGANEWRTYYEEVANVEEMDTMRIAFYYDLSGYHHSSPQNPNADAGARVSVDNEVIHSILDTGDVEEEWFDNDYDVSTEDEVTVKFEYYSESGNEDSTAEILWAEHEYRVPGDGYRESGHLIMDYKAMITSQPDLTALDYELPTDGTITVTVTGSPGQEGEESPDPVSLDGGTSYSLDWSEDHTYFALEIEMETDDEELTPVVSTITLSSDVEDHPEPQNVSLTDVFISSATLSWDKEEEADGYVLKASTDTDFSVYHSSSTQDIEVTTLTVSGLSVNTTYHFRVGNLFDGTTEWMSEPDHLSTSTLAEAPSLVEPAFTDVTCSTITVHWDGGDNPEWTPYVLEKSTEEFNGEVMKSTETYSDFFTFTGLEEKTTYYFRVKAVNNDGVETDYLHIGSTETLSADVPPAAVEEIWTSTETLTGGVRLWWESPGENEWEGTLGTESDPAEFRIQHSTRSDIEWGDHETFDLSISTWGVDPYETVSSTVSLSMETTYYFRLWTGNSHGEWSDISKGATEWARIAPAAVEDLQAQAEDDGSVDLSWTTPGNDGDDNDIDGGKYKIRMSTEAEVDWESDWDDSEGTWGDYSIEISTDITPDETHGMKVEGLRGGVSYYFHIWTRDSDEGANYPGNWSYISNRATETVTEVVSISISKGTYDFEEVVLDTSVVSSQSIDIENMGNVSLDYGLRISTITLPDNSYSLWKATDTASGHDLFMMYGLFNSADVSYDEFSVEDCITEELTSSTEEIFAGDQTGYGVEMGGVRRLWLRLDMPITLSRAREQRIKLRIEGTKE